MKKNFGLALAAIVAVGLSTTGCEYIKNLGVQKIKDGSNVKINYTLTVDNKVVDSSNGRDPLAYKQGAKQIIPGLEKALVGLKKGDRKKVVVGPEEGYGELNPKAVQKVPRKSLAGVKDLKIGARVRGQNNGMPVVAIVKTLNAKEATLDFNHPLAGKTLNFDVEIIDVKN